MVQLESSMISLADYNEELNEMFLIFKPDGVGYKFIDVPKCIYDDFLKSESKGKFFNENIKSEYGCIKINH